jgi:branched-chain amino acid transport system substrate-binding protein
MARHRFRAQAGPLAEGILFPSLSAPGKAEPDFVATFARHYGHEPDDAAAHTYDAVQVLIAAIRRAGLNRARIRDAVAGVSPWSGVSGPVIWDPAGSNARPAILATIREGRVVPATIPDRP